MATDNVTKSQYIKECSRSSRNSNAKASGIDEGSTRSHAAGPLELARTKEDHPLSLSADNFYLRVLLPFTNYPKAMSQEPEEDVKPKLNLNIGHNGARRYP